MNQTAPGNSVSHRRKILIVGGGLAGLATAKVLSQYYGSQVQVTVLEARRFAGGRVGSFHDSSMNVTVDYCQHVALGCCVNFLAFIRQCGLENDWLTTSQLNFFHSKSGVIPVRPWKWLPAPLHQLPLLWQLPFLKSTQRYEVQKALLSLARLKLDIHSRRWTAAEWLASHGQSGETIRNFWNVFSCSALGDEVRQVSIEALRQLFVQGFAAHRDAADLWIPRRPLSEIFGVNLVRHLSSVGVEVRMGESILELRARDSGCQVMTKNGELLAADHVVCAVPWHAVSRITAGVPELSYLKDAASIPSSAITGVHLWFDKPLQINEHLVSVGTLIQWIFKPSHDEVSRFVDDPIDASKSAHYYQVVISGSQANESVGNEALLDQVIKEIQRLIPGGKETRLVHARVVTDPRAVFVCHPTLERPVARTPLPFFHLAGDWIDTGWPATMEGAIISAKQAVASISETEGWSAHDVFVSQPKSWLTKLVLR